MEELDKEGRCGGEKSVVLVLCRVSALVCQFVHWRERDVEVKLVCHVDIPLKPVP